MILKVTLVGLVICLSILESVECDRVKILSKNKPENGPTEATSSPESGLEKKASIVKNYFALQGLSISLDVDCDRYETEVVEKMSELINERSDFVKAYHLNSQINSMIHGSLARHADSADEAILEALDYIVPNSYSQPILEQAKQDLRGFCIEQPNHCSELLERVRIYLDTEDLHTMEAIKFLEGTFHNWNALGRLINYIENFGQDI